MEKGMVRAAHPHGSLGDSVVSGLFGGLLGGMAMAVVIAGASLIAGQGVSYLGDFSAGNPVSPLQGVLMHLAVSGIYGMFFALLRRLIGAQRVDRVPGSLAGLIYAMLLWGFAVGILLPATHALILTLPWPGFFLGHVAYGLVLGFHQK